MTRGVVKVYRISQYNFSSFFTTSAIDINLNFRSVTFIIYIIIKTDDFSGALV